MDIQLTKRFLLACHTARHICESMPELPQGLTPRLVRIIDVIHQLQSQQDIVRVGDVSHLMNGTAPSITRSLNELTALGYVKKIRQASDRRVFSVQLTPSGNSIYKHYVYDFHHWLNERLNGLSSEDMNTAIRVIDRVAAEIQPVKSIFTDFAEQPGPKDASSTTSSKKKES